ncbi:MAG: hypothetical protein E7D13_04535, partial [Finegoldia magna]|nr:hypothetical protein [Finegoldia magna]
MKINKKLLMAALAGAIVVGGGVNSYAVDLSTVPEEVKDNLNGLADGINDANDKIDQKERDRQLAIIAENKKKEELKKNLDGLSEGLD